jgi:hypothetical protein
LGIPPVGVGVPLPVPLPDGVGVHVDVGVGVGLVEPVPLAEDDHVPLPVGEGVDDAVADGVGVVVPELEGVAEGVAGPALGEAGTGTLPACPPCPTVHSKRMLHTRRARGPHRGAMTRARVRDVGVTRQTLAG